MRFGIIGAGAIGGFLGARLAFSNHDVTFIARGATLEAIKTNGFHLIEEDGTERTVHCRAIAIQDAEPVDYVLLALKANHVSAVIDSISRLLHDQTAVVTLQNGIPWWYFQKLAGPYENYSVRCADPTGDIARAISIGRIIGTVVYPASEVIKPGVVKVIEGNRFVVGEPSNQKTPRVQNLSTALKHAGFKAPVSTDIRSDIWLKLWGNATFNPISALTHATLEEICQYQETRNLAFKIMTEAQTVADKLGVKTRVTIEQRIAGAKAVGAHKTSMLQDVEAGRELELEELVGSVIELAQLTSTPTPHLDAVYACARLLARTLKNKQSHLKIS